MWFIGFFYFFMFINVKSNKRFLLMGGCINFFLFYRLGVLLWGYG